VSRFAGAALKAKIASEGAARAVECCGPSPATRGAFKLDILLEKAARETGGAAFDAGVGRDAEDSREPEIEKLRWIGQATVEWGFSQEVPRMSAPDRRALVIAKKCRVGQRALRLRATPDRSVS
jgi:hypothetical protein